MAERATSILLNRIRDTLHSWKMHFSDDRVVRDLRGLRSLAARIDRAGPSLRELSDDALRSEATRLRAAGQSGEGGEAARVATFSLVREVARRKLGLWAFETQLIAACVLGAGAVAQLQTGEGKTLAAVFPAVEQALLGLRTQVWTANDYSRAARRALDGSGVRVSGVVGGGRVGVDGRRRETTRLSGGH